MKKKTLALLAAALLVVGCVIGSTFAWLTAQSKSVVNTFTTGDIKITLQETTGNEYKMIPGCTITKDPKVTVNKGSEECWLFVKLVKNGDFNEYMSYQMEEDWKELPGVDGVYYREVNADQIGTSYDILKGNQVLVSDAITKDKMKTLKKNATKPTLTVTAYACQLYKDNTNKFLPTEAWGNLTTK